MNARADAPIAPVLSDDDEPLKRSLEGLQKVTCAAPLSHAGTAVPSAALPGGRGTGRSRCGAAARSRASGSLW